MRLNISAYSIRRPIPALVLFMVVVALGALSFRSLPVTRLPNVDLPVVSVAVSQFGAAPSEIENQVTKIIENAAAGVAGVRHISSSVSDGLSTTVVEFSLETNATVAVNEVQNAVSRVRADLPRAIAEPVVQKVEIAGLPVVVYGVVAPGKSPQEVSWFVDETVKRALLGVNGIAAVERIGGADREIRVLLDPGKLVSANITASDVNRQLRSQDVDVSGGWMSISGREETIRTLGSARTLDALKAMPIATPSGSTVRLDALGTVQDGTAEPRTFAQLANEPIVALSIWRTKGASDVTVSRAAAAKLRDLAVANPGFGIRAVDSTVAYTIANYEATMMALLEGAVLAVVVVFVFLRDLRGTLIAALALPLSAIPAFWAMDALGFSLNLVSLLALTLSTGILVDDAIVEIENIIRHIRMGKSAYEAALEAADEIGLAVVAITATIIAVFMPSSFMGGVAGQFFKQFGATVAVAVFFSLLVARLVTPMLAAYFMTSKGRPVPANGRILSGYTRLVQWSVRHRLLTVVGGVVLFTGSIATALLLPTTFLPAEDTGRSVLVVELPAGSLLSDTRSKTDDITNRLRQLPEVRSVFVEGGRVPSGAPEVRKATVNITYAPRGDRKRAQAELERAIGDILAQVADIRFFFLNASGLRPVTIIVTGGDPVAVTAAANQLTSEMRSLSQLSNVGSNASLDRPEIRVTPRASIAVSRGVPTEAIAESIRIATIGDVAPNLPRFNADNQLVPIRVQIAPSALADRRALEGLRIPTPRGDAVTLGSVANIESGRGEGSIERYDRERSVTVEADLRGNAALGEAISAVMNLPAVRNAPPGVSIREAGDAETMRELFDGFARAMTYGLLMVYGVLVILFASFLQPITILLSLPLSIGGAMLGLLAAQQPISMPVSIGILMLMGIVTKNAIMLVDFGLEGIARGMTPSEAVVDAGRKRARPIVMTTFAMVAGMVPSALAIGAGGEARAPIAIAVIGGLIVSTVLSLVFVPAFFLLMDDIGRSARHIVRARSAAPLPPKAPAEAGPGESLSRT